MYYLLNLKFIGFGKSDCLSRAAHIAVPCIRIELHLHFEVYDCAVENLHRVGSAT